MSRQFSHFFTFLNVSHRSYCLDEHYLTEAYLNTSFIIAVMREVGDKHSSAIWEVFLPYSIDEFEAAIVRMTKSEMERKDVLDTQS